MSITEQSKKTFEVLSELDNKRSELFNVWVKTIVAISAGLVSVLVTLKHQKSDNIYEHILFSISIISLSISILSGIILLHRNIHMIDKLRFWTVERLSEQIFDNDYSIKSEVLRPNIAYRISESVFYVALTLAILSLTVYAILKDY